MDKIITSLGLMSGTSLDGIDASIIKSDGNSHLEILLNKFFPYSHDFKQKLGNYINNINSLKDIENSKLEYKELEREITLYHSQISNEIISEQNISLDIVGFHGQTIIHKPSEKYTIQMGDPNLLSQILKKKVIFNFRKNDIENNGEGAPLTPIYHSLIAKKIFPNKPSIFLNIGGITNYTYCDGDNLRAKDIGPGNVLIDEYLKKTKNLEFDLDGNIASQGKVNMDIINQFIEHEIYNSKNRHSYDRSEFDFNFVKGLEFEDAVSTLNYFTALIISNFLNENFDENTNIILCGGGRKNKTLSKNIKNLTKKNVVDIDEFNFDGDFIESQAFAYLAIRSFFKKNISYPKTTKVKKPITGGEVFENF